MDNCIFCKVIDGKIPALRVFENDSVIAINDIHPHAKNHILVIPKKHITSLRELYTSGSDPDAVVASLFSAANQIVQQEGLIEGYRSVINTGENGGQTIPHLHLHILGGEKLSGSFG